MASIRHLRHCEAQDGNVGGLRLPLQFRCHVPRRLCFCQLVHVADGLELLLRVAVDGAESQKPRSRHPGAARRRRTRQSEVPEDRPPFGRRPSAGASSTSLTRCPVRSRWGHAGTRSQNRIVRCGTPRMLGRSCCSRLRSGQQAPLPCLNGTHPLVGPASALPAGRGTS